MPHIIPFRGYLYDQSKNQLSEVIAPPYDVISPAQQDVLYERSPYNVVRLILGREEDRYSAAAAALREWIEKGILIRDDKPAIYLLHQTFDGPEERTVTRRGFIALCRLEEFDKKVVLPHERTLSKPREDRFKLFKATNANFSQVFSLYSDPEKSIDRALNGVSKTEPVIDVMFERVQNKMWKIQEDETIQAIKKVMEEKQVLIADGHHRYETALAYRDQMRSQNDAHTGKELYNYVMMFFTNVDDEGLVIYPTHRIVHSLEQFKKEQFFEDISEYFVVREFRERGDLVIALRSSPVPSFGVVAHGEGVAHLLTVKPSVTMATYGNGTPHEVNALDVTVLHSLILSDVLGISAKAQEQKLNLDYVRDAADAFRAVDSGKAQLAFLMNPTKIGQVRAIARAGYTMPQKSTYFYPKLVSGLVLHTMD